MHAAAAGPVIGVVGLSGVGKTTTVTALFEPVAPTAPLRSGAGVVSLRPPRTSAPGRLRVVDVPGLGVDVDRDDALLDAYGDLDGCDVVLWVLAARSRAIALDQVYLRRLAPPADRTVFGLNQVDLLEPREWTDGRTEPSSQQATVIGDAVDHRRRSLAAILGRTIEIWPYSALTGYGVGALFDALVTAVRPARRVLLASLRRPPP